MSSPETFVAATFLHPGSGRSSLNLERRLDHDGHPLAIAAADAVAANGVPPWNWRDTTANGNFKFFSVVLSKFYRFLAPSMRSK